MRRAVSTASAEPTAPSARPARSRRNAGKSARLLHDTVLATLTLLAHSGVGVSPAALQQQAADDARLLRQLRLGATPVPQSSGGYNLEVVEEAALGTTLESVKQRFGRMGLEVSWHGTGQVLLPSHVLDAFLLALAECLENVRRHAGVTEAHVTITDDETTVRAMVTDSGVGFDLKDVDSARLGLKDSVVGRLNEVGGNARLFSAPGAGRPSCSRCPNDGFSRPDENTLGVIVGKRKRRQVATPSLALQRASAHGASLGTGYLGVGAVVIAGIQAVYG